MPSDDLQSHALSTEDYYALLELEPNASEGDVRRAYRRTALKYHPDKVGADTPGAVDKFHLLQIANDVLSNAAAREVYDNARRAREERQAREQAMGASRRAMVADLERRERAAKRGREEDEADDRLQAEIRRLAADGARRVKEKQEQLRREQEDEERRRRSSHDAGVANTTDRANVEGRMYFVSDMDKAVKVKWRREGTGKTLDKDHLEEMCRGYGEVDVVVILKDKKKKLGESSGTPRGTTTTITSAVVFFKSVADAFAAVDDPKRLASSIDSLESLTWSAGEEPRIISDLRAFKKSTNNKPIEGGTYATADEIRSIRMRLAARKLQESRDAAKAAAKATADEADNRPGVRKVPSFASVRDFNTPQKPPPKFSFSASNTPVSYNSPVLEQMQKKRQRDEERRRLEEQIRAEEAAEDEK
ncbi:hypothetical protein ANO11243_069720 [Dothideomycetidae sp. 11243]|nr:hypothetical protein ANO11243_069720 [fungal sp. No.11243]